MGDSAFAAVDHEHAVALALGAVLERTAIGALASPAPGVAAAAVVAQAAVLGAVLLGSVAGLGVVPARGPGSRGRPGDGSPSAVTESVRREQLAHASHPDDYVAWRTATTRWRDDDAYGHLNNATYYELFDTAVNAHLYEATGEDVRALPQIGVVAETGCRYFREIGFPEPIEMGLVVDKVGTSSIVYRIGLFQGGPTRPRPRAVSSTSTSTTRAGPAIGR